ncbi:MAG: excinuclease ABC subunit UvrC [Ruminococcaceae bacterium]|nr:excinuclease ABC subunit UvrC [Oscillospiraceae bacterium]
MNNSRLEYLRQKALGLPMKAGVYKMLDKDSNIIYIGKAKFLKNRVYSYFNSVERHNEKTYALVSVIYDFEIIIAGNELEALLLENNLIKENKPKYNILLKDDKGYPFIKIDIKSDFPRVTMAYRRDDKNAKYFGPFGSKTQTLYLVNAVNKAYKLPTCSSFTKSKPCLNNHIGKCMGVCSGQIDKQEYRQIIKNVTDFFAGKTAEASQSIKKYMIEASERTDYEKAAYYRDTLKAIENIADKQTIINDQKVNADAVALVNDDKSICVSLIRVRGGKMLGSFNYVFDALQPSSNTLFEFLTRFYEQESDIPKVIYLDTELEDRELLKQYLEHLSKRKLEIVMPKASAGKKLLQRANENAKEYLLEHNGHTDKISRRLTELSHIAALPKVPSKIEIYDISQTAGSDTVCGMAVFVDGKPEKKLYRRFIINSALAGDDCGAMKEAVTRRLSHTDGSFGDLPELIIADGGQAQVGAIIEVLKAAGLKINVIGLKKDKRHRTKSLVREDMSEILLQPNPEAFIMASLMQNEVHRFAIDFHKQRRSKNVKSFELTQIEGIGNKKALAVLQHFKSVKKVREASVEELLNVKGINRDLAQKIYDFFRQ